MERCNFFQNFHKLRETFLFLEAKFNKDLGELRGFLKIFSNLSTKFPILGDISPADAPDNTKG